MNGTYKPWQLINRNILQAILEPIPILNGRLPCLPDCNPYSNPWTPNATQ